MRRRATLVCLAVGLSLAILVTGGEPSAATAEEAPGRTDAVHASIDDGSQEPGGQGAAPAESGANPVIVVETSKGTFEFELYAEDAPRSVAHILALVERSFYDGMRVHRVEPEFVVQFGDPYSRDLDRQSIWGRGGSGRVIGAAEISPKYTHEVGAVGLAYAAHPSMADSQLYIILAYTERSQKLDGEYAVIGKVRTGMDVVQTIERLDTVERVRVR